jgi:hypothetical protein
MAGYSGTPLPQKLGIKPGQRVLLLRTPPAFELEGADGVEFRQRPGSIEFDVMLAFAKDSAKVARDFDKLPGQLTTAGALWIAWPKKASGVATDLDENVVRKIGLDAGLVDVKVCAIDDTWSGLKFVRRVRDR